MTSLFSTPLSAIVPKNQQLVTIPAESSVLDALKTLSSKNIYSAPVKDQKGAYSGFLDMADIVVSLVTLMEERSSHSFDQNSSFFDAVAKDKLETAKNIADLSKMNPMVPLREKDSLGEALKIFESTGTHRVPVLSGDSVADINGVLTQIDVISYLASNLSSLGDAGKKTLQEHNVKLNKVISVEIGARAFEAFQLMSKNRITGVAVLNHDGTLFSNLSMKDIKEVKPEELLVWMNKSALELIQMIRCKQIDVAVPVFSCHLHNTLEQVIAKLNVLRVHRLFITDDQNKPIGVLTLGDIFRLIHNSSA